MEHIDYIIHGDYVLTMNSRMDLVENGAIAVKDRLIVDVDTSEAILAKYSAPNIIEGKNRVVLPGLINTHTHAAMVYFRGLADDLPLKEWLENHIWPAESKWLSPEFVSDAVELACIEMLKAGVTTYTDMYFFEDSAALAAKKTGIRAVIGAGVVDFPTVSGKTADDYLKKAERLLEDWKNDELIKPCIAAHSAYACCPETLKKIKTMTEKYAVPRQIHLAETEWEVSEIMSRYGLSPVKHLDSIGFLDGHVLAAHCVWVNSSEIEMLAKRNVAVSHCIESNMKLASGIAPIPEMLRAGVKVAFGTDGAASNNDLNILSEMSTAAKVHKATSKDPTVLDSRTVLLMATRWGAEAAGLGDKTGSIEKEKLADIISIDMRKPHLSPVYDVYSHIVYAAMASDIEDVMVNGRLVVDKRKAVFCNEDAVIDKAAEWALKINSR